MTHFKSCTSKMNTVRVGLDNVYVTEYWAIKLHDLQFRNRFSQKQKILYNSISAFRPFLWKGINQAYKLLI